MKRILIVEDEPAMRQGLRDNFEFEGYEVDTAEDGKIGLDKLLKNSYDLVLLDIMLPHMSGYDVCKQVRKEQVEIPVIFLSAKGEEIDKVLGLELGADDYITKPFGLRELLARVKAVLRRGNSAPSSSQSHELSIGKLKVNFHTYTAEVEGVETKMSHREFEILQFMWQHQNEVVSRFTLLEEIWGYKDQPTTRTVDNFIVKLRQKIESDPNQPKIILTVHGVGYKLLHV